MICFSADGVEAEKEVGEKEEDGGEEKAMTKEEEKVLVGMMLLTLMESEMTMQSGATIPS